MALETTGDFRAHEEIHDTTQNAGKCVIPAFREQGDAWYERKYSRRCPCVPILRNALSTETSLAETMRPSLQAASLRSTASHDNIVLLRRLSFFQARYSSPAIGWSDFVEGRYVPQRVEYTLPHVIASLPIRFDGSCDGVSFMLFCTIDEGDSGTSLTCPC